MTAGNNADDGSEEQTDNRLMTDGGENADGSVDGTYEVQIEGEPYSYEEATPLARELLLDAGVTEGKLDQHRLVDKTGSNNAEYQPSDEVPLGEPGREVFEVHTAGSGRS